MDHNVRPSVVAAALMHAIERGWARGEEKDDWREAVALDEEDAIEVLRARNTFRYLLGSHPQDADEAVAVARALARVPTAWRGRARQEVERLAWSWPQIREIVASPAERQETEDEA